ncbi:hypothetical protein [Pontibacter rugosus]|uniref:Uncharacterized protein n=1 Tax=Pontibacter rugosus TaxID=1745966 RepID=A0ABW3SL03_9BACT
MEATPVYQLKRPSDATPEEILRAFRLAYSLPEVQAALRHCLHPRDTEAANLPALYENIDLLLSAVYQLPLPAPTPLAAALDSLSQQVSHNWVLLICPPE